MPQHDPIPSDSASGAPSTTQEQKDVSAPKRQGIIISFLAWWLGLVNGTVFPGTVGRSVVGVVLIVLGLAIGEAYQFARGYFIDPDEKIDKIANEQKNAFDKLENGLQSLRGAVDDSGKKTLSGLEDSVTQLKVSNAALIAELRDSSRGADGKDVQTAAGAGGYSGATVVIQANASIDIDPSTSIGIQRVGRSSVDVRVSSLAADASRGTTLNVGEFVSYRKENGQTCKTTLISLSDDRKATFRTACASP